MVNIEEYNKCKNDMLYFLENYFKVLNTDEDMVQFKFKGKQKEAIDFINNNQHSIVIDERLTGKTTLLIGIILYNAIFSEDITIGFVGFKLDFTKCVFDRVMCSYKELPEWIKPKITKHTRTEIEFENRVKLLGFSYSSNLRGISFNLLLMDEIAYSQIDNKQCFETIIPIITSGNYKKSIIITSFEEGLKSNTTFTSLLDRSISGQCVYKTLVNTKTLDTNKNEELIDEINVV